MTNKKILIVDDDPDVRLALHIRLQANGYDTAVGYDALTAISEARRFEPDLIILDLGLPAGDGFVVLQRLQAITNLAMIPVIVVSARDRHSNENRAHMAGAAVFLQKPVDNDELLLTIRRTLG